MVAHKPLLVIQDKETIKAAAEKAKAATAEMDRDRRR
jgi:hypothetical protein